MKKLLILIAFGIISANSFSQNYTFSLSSGAYSDLTGATDLTNGEPWSFLLYDGAEWWDPIHINYRGIPIGFDFECYGSTFDSLFIRDYVHFDKDDNYFINPFFVLFYNRGNSPVSYLLEGDEGSRILKIEWKNMGFWGEYNVHTTANDFVNVQLWLYEGSNNIEVHMGPSSVTHPDESYFGYGGPWIGIAQIVWQGPPMGVKSLALVGDPSDPQIAINDTTFNTYLNGTPPDTVVYVFTYDPSGITSPCNDQVDLSVYPNPSGGVFNISLMKESGKTKVCVFDVRGKLVYSEMPGNGGDLLQIDLSDQNRGLYFLNIESEQGEIINRKLILK